MTDDQPPASEIVCAGTLSHITCYSVRSLTLDGYGETPSAITTLLGNDAVIVARLLAGQGRRVRCVLLGPARADMAALEEFGPAGLTVQPTWIRPGPATTSAVLEAPGGSRYWLLPPAGHLSCHLPQISNPAIVYADLYDELEDFLLPQLSAVPAWRERLIVNLSGTRHLAKAEAISALRPLAVQASLPSTTTPQAIQHSAVVLQEQAAASYAAVTAGTAGAALASSGQRWFCKPGRPLSSPGLGAGAAFSVGLITALLGGVRGPGLLASAQKSALSYLTPSSCHEVTA